MTGLVRALSRLATVCCHLHTDLCHSPLRKDGRAIWQSHLGTGAGTYFVSVQDDGNVVVYVQDSGASRAVWATHTAQANNLTDRASAQVPPTSPQQGGQIMSPNSWLQSANGQFRLNLQEDGNLVLMEGGRVLWSPQTEGKGVTRLDLTREGTVVLASQDGRRIWQSHSGSGEPGTYALHVQDDGKVVVYSQEVGGARAVWATYTARPPQATAPPISRPSPPSTQTPTASATLVGEWSCSINGRAGTLKFSEGQAWLYLDRGRWERLTGFSFGGDTIRFVRPLPDLGPYEQVYTGRLISPNAMEGTFDCASGRGQRWSASQK